MGMSGESTGQGMDEKGIPDPLRIGDTNQVLDEVTISAKRHTNNLAGNITALEDSAIDKYRGRDKGFLEKSILGPAGEIPEILYGLANSGYQLLQEPFKGRGDYIYGLSYHDNYIREVVMVNLIQQ